ncbi:MAG: hypothetical protein ABSD77_01780 [Verrucomicrobiota bacterium]|jgi:hypothetical protein
MIRKLSLALIILIFATSIVYVGLLTNWFRYGVSLEALFVIIPLTLGTLLSAIVTTIAYWKRSTLNFVIAIVATVTAAGFTFAAQREAFGVFPSFYTNDIQKCPIGRIPTSQGEVEYWIELENPFANSHREYLFVHRKTDVYRIQIQIFDSGFHAVGYTSANNATDWGELTATSDSNIFLLKLGPSFIPGGRFKINLVSQQATRAQSTTDSNSIR